VVAFLVFTAALMYFIGFTLVPDVDGFAESLLKNINSKKIDSQFSRLEDLL